MSDLFLQLGKLQCLLRRCENGVDVKSICQPQHCGPGGRKANGPTCVQRSFVTLTTIGYGDVVPLHPYARGLANVEAIIGQLYPATLLARLVTLELAVRHG